MSTCTTEIDLISEDEYIGESLPKINKNFSNLQASACDLKEKVDKQINIRTFFYYGPNTPANPQDGTAGMDNNQLSRPSDATIQNFVNAADQLNLKPLSDKGDIAYVIYQKTGWYVPPAATYLREGSGQVPFTKIVTYTVSYQVGGSSSSRKIGIAGKCWVAREAYEGYSPKWQIFKDWLFDSGKGPLWLQKIYLKYGESFASWVSTKTKIKNFLVKLFDIVVKKQNLDEALFITTPEGPIKASNIKPGSIIYGYDHKTGDLKECKVLASTSVKNVIGVKIYHEHGELIVPFDQKIYVEEGDSDEDFQYIEARKLKVGNFIYLENNQKSKILNIKTFKIKTPLQKIEVEDKHNYILNGVRVHNRDKKKRQIGGARWVTETRTAIVTYYVGYSWSTTIEDTYRQYEPIFVTYRLTYDGSEYIMDSGWPKYSKASTESTNNWNNPQTWLTY